MKRLLQKCCFGNRNKLTQTEVDQEDKTRHQGNTGLDNTKQIRDELLDQVVWRDVIRTVLMIPAQVRTTCK